MSIIPPEEYLRILSKTKLTCVDLIIKNQAGQVLLGYRVNKPAQHTWFVPGGAIRKAESISEAVKRVTLNELGLPLLSSTFTTLAEHNYPDNFAHKPNVESNFVVLGFSCTLESDNIVTDSQHEALKWWDVKDLLASPEVHPFTKAYLEDEPSPEVIVFRV